MPLYISYSNIDTDLEQYIDTLCRELGINTKRKSNMVSEMFAPYKPSDYNGLIDEFLRAQARKERGMESV